MRNQARAASIGCAQARDRPLDVNPRDRGLWHPARPGDLGTTHGGCPIDRDDPGADRAHWATEPDRGTERDEPESARTEPRPRNDNHLGRTIAGPDDRAEARRQDAGHEPER